MKKILVTSLLLGLFAVIGAGLVAYTHHKTHDRIEAQKVKKRLRSLNKIIRPEEYDNAILDDKIEITNRAVFGTDKPVSVYRARKQGKPVALVFTAFAPDGYNGDIELLVGVRYDGTISGVRVVDHKETPGLGDAIDIRKSDWITGFDNKSLNDPGESGWHVKKDGGRFDQFTGATITPRAVVKAVHRVLNYAVRNRDRLYRIQQNTTQKPADKS